MIPPFVSVRGRWGRRTDTALSTVDQTVLARLYYSIGLGDWEAAGLTCTRVGE